MHGQASGKFNGLSVVQAPNSGDNGAAGMEDSDEDDAREEIKERMNTSPQAPSKNGEVSHDDVQDVNDREKKE